MTTAPPFVAFNIQDAAVSMRSSGRMNPNAWDRSLRGSYNYLSVYGVLTLLICFGKHPARSPFEASCHTLEPSMIHVIPKIWSASIV
jgi:hypothetical protein